MNVNQQHIFQTRRKYLSSIIFFLLLIIRLFDDKFPVWLFSFENSDQFNYWYSGSMYLLTILLIWLNRTNLEKINIDKYSIYLLLLGGCIWLIYLPTDLGILAAVSVSFILWALYNKQIYFSDATIKYPPDIWLLMLVSIGVAIAPVFYYRVENYMVFSVHFLLVAGLEAQLAFVVFEEVLFRGALWSFLKSSGLKNGSILFLQALLFWISHHRYISLNNPYLFWFSLPLNALLFGLIVWRSKSLTPSIISHFLYNLISAFVINALG